MLALVPLPRSVLLPGGHAQELDAFYCFGFLSNPTWGGGMNANGERIAPFQTYCSDFKNLGSDLSIYHVLTSGHKYGSGKEQSWDLTPGVTDPGHFLEASHLRRGGAHLLRPFSPVPTSLLLKSGFAGVEFGFYFFSKFLLKHFSLFLIDRDRDQ